MSSGAAPLVHKLEANVEPVGTAGNDLDTVVGEAPFAGTVTSVTYTPEDTITGAATNHRRFRLINKGAAGNGTTIVAELIMDNGVNAADYDERAITLSATAANLEVAAGDILAWESTHIGTGITDPGGRVQVLISRS